MKRINGHFFLVTRMFSGLYESISAGEWQPSGIPTITKLVEKVSARGPFTWIISCKTTTESAVVNHCYTEMTLGGLDIRVIPYKEYVCFGRVNLLINSLVTLFTCLKLGRARRKKVCYCDRTNVLPAACMTIFSNAVVVLRVLGVYPDQKLLATSLLHKARSLLTFLAYKARFDLCVCTQDGSGVEYFLSKLLRCQTPQQIFVNGVKNVAKGDTPRSEKQTVSLLFVGKLIEEKGILDLLEAATLLAEKRSNFIFHVVGKGGLDEHLAREIRKRGLEERIRLEGSVPHGQVIEFYKKTDIYISLNRLGNLSNTVLEAMSAGKCIMMLEKDDLHMTDHFTDRAVPHDAAIRISRKNTAVDLAVKLAELCEQPEKVGGYAEKMEKFADLFLRTWDERLEAELDVIDTVCRARWKEDA